MKIILKESFRYFIAKGSALILATIFSCYMIAVLKGHVPIWLPMISDCGVHSPEKYFFTYGLVVGSVLVCAESVLLYYADGKYFFDSGLCLTLSFVASLAMGVVGVVNEKAIHSVHLLAAFVAFGGFLVFMVMLTYLSSTSGSTIGPTSMAIKRVCTIVGVCAMAILIMFYISGVTDFNYAIGENPPFIALCEWIVMSSIMIFNISFYADVSGIYLCEVNAKSLKNQE